MPFACSICEQESTKICVSCTKDACHNHLCERCGCCSDCCECDVPLDETPVHHVPIAEPDQPVAADPVASLDPEVSHEAEAQPATPLPAFDSPPAEAPETPEL